MKILLCSHQFSIGGISKVVHELRNAFRCLHHNVDVLAPAHISNEQNIIFIPCLNIPGLIGSLSFWEQAMRFIEKKKNNYDIIMMHHPVLLSNEFSDLPNSLIITFHGTYYGYSRAYHLYNLGHLGLYYDIASQIERKLLSTLSRIKNSNITLTGVSPSTISELHSNGYRGVAHFIPNAFPTVDKQICKEKARTILNRYLKLQINPRDRLLLYVGSARNVASKRPLLIPSLFKELKRSDDKLKLIMIGGGYSSNQLKNFMRNDKKISYFDYIPAEQLYLFYSSADAYVSLSCYEGLPNSVLEAAAYGLPLILSNIPAHKWIISSKIGHGLLINSFNPMDDIDIMQSFFNSIPDLWYFSNPDVSLKFGWNQIAKEYLMKMTS